MDLRIFTEPQEGATYEDIVAAARATENLGYDGFFRSDHYLAIFGDGMPGPTDAWTTLAGLARDTSRVRLGTLVTSVTFRLPGLLAVTVADVDRMSGGRVELGLGTGWFEAEHAAYGIPFPPLGERFDRLEEQLAIVTGLWGTPVGERYSYAGTHYQLTGAPALPKPVQSPPPVIIGGGGARRTPALAARYAAEFNMPFASVADTGAQFERVAAAVRDAGRDGIVLSAAQVLCCGKDEAELRRRAAAIGRDVAELRANGIAGTPAECVDRIGRFAELGATRLYLQTLDVDDLDHVDLVAAEVMPQVR